ncbi:DYNC2I2 [Symbiodinium sp. CCMP2456]|nr:DYNC2I2 [Symbiodinium sp. CCMP2456]
MVPLVHGDANVAVGTSVEQNTPTAVQVQTEEVEEQEDVLMEMVHVGDAHVLGDTDEGDDQDWAVDYASSSSSSSVKLFDVLQQRAAHTFFPPARHLSTCAVSAAAWSSARPCVFAVAMEMGGVYVYDLLQSRQEPVMELPLTGGTSQKVTSLAFNPKQRGMIAVGDDSGRVRVFRLPFRLSEQQKSEMAFIATQLLGDKGRGTKETKDAAPPAPPPPPPPPPA